MEESKEKKKVFCAGCLNDVANNECIFALQQHWHRDCFRCSACDSQLSSWYVERGGLLHCPRHYWARFTDACHKCAQVLTGPAMTAGPHRFHPECFTCCSCHRALEDHQPYALLERSLLYCSSCESNLPALPLRHAVRSVQAPPRSLRVQAAGDTYHISHEGLRGKICQAARALLRATLAFCVHVTCASIDIACGWLKLRVGDRVLEINGAPPAPRPPPAVLRARAAGDQDLQLTVEQNADWTIDNYIPNSNEITIHSNVKNQNIPTENTDIVNKRNRLIENNTTTERLIHDQYLERDVDMTDKRDTNIEVNLAIERYKSNQMPLENDIDMCKSGSQSVNSDVKERRMYNSELVTNKMNLEANRQSTSEAKLNQNTDKSELEAKSVTDGDTNTLGVKLGTSDTHTSEVKLRTSDTNVIEVKLRTNDTKTNASEMKLGTSDTIASEVKLEEGKRERVFKRKVEGGRARVLRKRQPASSPLLQHKERSSSMSVLRDTSENGSDSSDENCESGVERGLSRARSFRARPAPRPTVFRAADLVQGELLGSGFFGAVYKVTHRETREVMVLKQLYRLDEDAQRNFLKEVAVLRSLDHPNVLKFVGVLYKDKQLHLVTEYVPGGTLYQLIQDKSIDLPWCVRARLARDVCAGVRYLHRVRVIHRDLNSHNCLVRQDKTVIVADFGLARIVRRPAGTLRRKRYTVVGNPYWMAPEMMNGDLYDELVDVFSFGIILCEIIGRVSADPDYLPRRADFGLHEAQFRAALGAACPEPLVRLAVRATQRSPDHRPSFESMEPWLEAIHSHLSAGTPLPAAVLQQIDDICSEQDCCQPREKGDRETVVPGEKVEELPIKPTTEVPPCERPVRRIPKCVSASHIGRAPARVTVTNLASSQQSLRGPPAYILHATGNNINITQVHDISEWLPPPAHLKRTSPDAHLNIHDKSRKMDENLPPFLRNQSVEGLETESKCEADEKFCRHFSVPDNDLSNDSDSSDEDLTDITDWYNNVSTFDKGCIESEPKKVLSSMVKKVEGLVSKANTHNVANAERKASRTISPVKEVKSPPKDVDVVNKTVEKTNFFAKKLLSPKLSRLFKPNTNEVVRSKTPDENKTEKSKSKFFVQKPSSPSNIRSYRVRPTEKQDTNKDVLKSDLKLASMGKPMTPIFRRHVPSNNDFSQGRFSYRDRRPKYDARDKYVDYSRHLSKTPVFESKECLIEPTFAPLTRSVQTTNVAALTNQNAPNSKMDARKPLKKRELGISRSNYVSLANLRINGKSEVDKTRGKAGPQVTPTLEKVSS